MSDDDRIDRFYVAVGSKVKDARASAGLSQSELAQRIGFTRSSVANLEAGRQRIGVHLLVLIAQALDAKAAALLPEASLLEGDRTLDDLQEHLAGTPETTQDFVRSAVAQLTNNPLHSEP